MKFTYKIKFTVKNVILLAAIVVLIGAMIAGNLVLSQNAPLIHQVFAGNTTDYNGKEVENALKLGDETCIELAGDSMVLLKNKNDVLPLAKDAKINLFGWNATDLGFMLTGGGSGGTVIHPDKKVTLTQAMEKEGMEYNKALISKYEEFNNNYDADMNSNADNRFVNPPSSFYTDTLMNEAKAYSDVAVVVLSRFARENNGWSELVNINGYNNGTYLSPSENENAMLDKVRATFDKVIVLFNTTNTMSLTFLEDKNIDCALYVGLPGQSGARAIPRILRGDINPSGKTTDTHVYDYTKYDPTFANAARNGQSIHYAEGIYFGYKWYETAAVEGFFDDVNNKYGKGYDGVVQYPFGYGLSYEGTDFKWEIESEGTTLTDGAKMTEESEYTLKVRVTNEGERPGKDVVQLYSTPWYNKGEIEKAHVNLLAFAKTTLLEHNESQVVTLKFSAYDLASYDDYDKNNNGWEGYEIDEGKYGIKLMENSHKPAECEKNTFTLKADEDLIIVVDPVTQELVENRFTGQNAYANMPIDGSTVHNNIKYMSRSDFKGTFPTVQTAQPVDSAAVNAASVYEYDFRSVSDVKQGQSGDLRLVVKADGSPASADELSGKIKTELKYNEELLKDLQDYKSPVWNDLLNQLAESEIKDLIGKGGFKTWHAASVGKPSRVDRDGPAGFNMGVSNPNTDSRWTAYPAESLIGCSWNPMLTYNMGRVQGVEAQATGLSGWYAPGVNLHRSPFNSRNFEYYGEDGVLSGKLAAELIRGAKQNNLYCYIKHFAVSEAGQNPAELNTWLTEQTLREIYLKPFEIAVKEGGANAIMSAFNRVGAIWAGSNYALDTQILRDEWGFNGTMITDWYGPAAYMHYERGVKSGNDLWLNNTNGTADLDMSKTQVAYRARISAKNILYTFVDTYVTAKYFAENGDPNDPYKTSLDIVITEQPFSPLFVFLWVLIDVVLVAGMAVCALFVFKMPKPTLPNGNTDNEL